MEDFEAAQPIDRELIGKIEPGSTIGQTITLRRVPLANIQLLLRMSQGASDFGSIVQIEILDSPEASEPLTTTTLSYGTINAQTPVTIAFPPVTLVAGAQYYLRLSAEGTPIWVYGRGVDAYTTNQAYLDDQPVSAHLAFRYEYHYGWSHFMADVSGMLAQGGSLLWGVVCLFLPGMAYLSWTRLHTRFDATIYLALATTLSLSILAIVMVWTSTLDLTWNQISVRVFGFLLVIAFVLAVIIKYSRRQKTSNIPNISQTVNAEVGFEPRRINWTLVCLGVIFIGALLVRLAMIRDLSAPPWVDAVHHGIITRMILADGQIPTSYAPYSPIETAHYHTGYHSNLAFFLWLSELDIIKGMLLHGQLLNAFSVLAAYLLTVALLHNHQHRMIAGLVAALVTGFITPMPAYYTSWSRYTQLAGILILPGAFLLVRQGLWLFLHQGKNPLMITIRDNLPLIVGASISLAGLFLVHYRVAAFLACLLLADLLANAPPRWGAPLKRYVLTAGMWYPSIALLSALLILTWIIPTFQTLLMPRLQEWSTAPAAAFSDFRWQHLSAGAGIYALYAAAAGLLLAVIRQPRLALTLTLWVAGMFLLANVGALGLPGSGFVTNVSVLIILFLPISVATGYLGAALWLAIPQRIPGRFRKVADGLAIATLIITAVLGSRMLVNILNPTTIFFHEADRNAIAWLDENLPEEAGFLINPAGWGYGLYVGSDGGYWISPLSRRVTFPPSLLYSYGEGWQTIEVNQAVEGLLQNAETPEAIWEAMGGLGLDYLYLGAHGGPLSPVNFVQSALFEIVYRQEEVWILRRVSR